MGLALRLLYVTVVAPAPVGLDGDWHFYSSAADLIAQGHFYYRGIFHRAFSTAEHPPLYPLVLGAAVWLGAKGVLAQRIVSCALGSAAVVLFGMLGRRVAGDRVGLAAAGLAAVYPPLIVVDGALDSEPLMVVGLLACLLLVYRLRERPTPRHAALLGAVLGLTTLAHTAAVLLVPLLLVPVAWRPRGGRGTRTCAALAAFAAVIAPWLARNELAFHRLTLGTDSNTVIAGANCQKTYYGRDIGWWELSCDARGRTFQELVRGDANPQPALRYIRHHLTRVPLVASVRILRTFSLYQPLREGNGQIRRRWLDIVGLAIYYPVLILAALGWRRLPAWRWPFAALIAVAIIVSAIDSGLPRLRIPADVSLIVLAAAGTCMRGAAARGAPPRARSPRLA